MQESLSDLFHINRLTDWQRNEIDVKQKDGQYE